MNVNNRLDLPALNAAPKGNEGAAGQTHRHGTAKPDNAGKSDQSPAFQARALIASDPSQKQGTFGALVSMTAKDDD
jgi:hypothetical protein